MAYNKTLTVFLADVREAAGIEGLTDRHTDATLTKWINLEWRLMRTRLANAGLDGLTIPTTIAALPTSAPVSTEQYLQVDWPDGAVGVYGIDVLISSKWEPLEPISFARRRDFQSGAVSGVDNVPGYYFPITLPTESTTSITAGKIALVPLATGANNYRIWYLPTWTDVTSANNVFYGHDAWFDYAIQGVVRRVAQKDNDADETLKEAVQRQGEAWSIIERSIRNMNLDRPVKRVRADRRRDSRWGA